MILNPNKVEVLLISRKVYLGLEMQSVLDGAKGLLRDHVYSFRVFLDLALLSDGWRVPVISNVFAQLKPVCLLHLFLEKVSLASVTNVLFIIKLNY